MRITELLQDATIDLGVKVNSKEEAIDGEPSDVFFMIAAPAEGSDVHLEALSRLSVILMDPVFKDSLLKATSKEECLNKRRD
mgnify:CR=1 FL=1